MAERGEGAAGTEELRYVSTVTTFDPTMHDDNAPLDAAFLAAMRPSGRGRPSESGQGSQAMTEDEAAQTVRDNWQTALYEASRSYSLALRALAETNPWPERPVLGQAIDTLATELWDRCFSVTEIILALQEAVADLPRYAAGEEVRL